jgi:hypothetical protein
MALTTDAGLLPLNLQPALPLDPPSRIIDAGSAPTSSPTRGRPRRHSRLTIHWFALGAE